MFLVTGVVAAGRWGREISASDSNLPVDGETTNSETVGAAELTVEPGDIEIERGTAVTVVARFGRVVPTDVVMLLTTEEGTASFTLDPTVDAGVFATRVNAVNSDATYRPLDPV